MAQICARLEGIPLALELAAARTPALPQIISRLDDRLGLRAGGGRVALSRQRTLRATLDWSCDLLAEPEQLLLWRLSVFTGGWTLEAAEGVCVGEGIQPEMVLDLLTALIQKPLLTFEDHTLDDTKAVASALGNLGNIAVFQGDYELARERFTESLIITRELGEPRPTAASLSNLGFIALARGDHAAGWELNTEALQIFRGLEDKQGIARTVHTLALAAHLQDDDDQAQALHKEALTLFRELQEPRGISDAISGLGDTEMRRGDHNSARALYQESLTLRRDLGLKEGVENSLREFASLRVRCREPRRAARLWGSAEALRESVGVRLTPAKQDLLDREVAATRDALGAEAFTAAWVSGHSLPWEQAVAEALDELV